MSIRRTQLWPHMGLLSTVLFAVFISAWLHFSDTTLVKWLTQIQQPANIAWQSQMITFAALITAIAISWWLLYIPGGRDNFLHIEGPRLLTHRAAHRHAKAQFRRERRHEPHG